MKTNEVCPLCVTEMLEDNRKLGKDRKFLVCPNCGYRENINNSYYLAQKKTNVLNFIDNLNLYGGNKQGDTSEFE